MSGGLPLKPPPGEALQDFHQRIRREVRVMCGLGPRPGETARAYAKRLIRDEAVERKIPLGAERAQQAKKPTHEDLKDLLVALHQKKKPPPNASRAFLYHLTARRSRGPDPEALMDRDDLLCWAVDLVAVDCNVPWTRNPATRADAATTIVAAALRSLGENIAEKRVARIWQQARKRLRK